MNRTTVIFALLAALGSFGNAGTPIANVSSSQPVVLDGKPLSVAGVSTWPVLLGDDIATSTAPATMSFQDGSKIKLAPSSHAKLSGSAAHPKLTLLAGSLDYKLAAGSDLSLSTDNPPSDSSSNGNSGNAAKLPKTVTDNTKTYLFGTLGAAALLGVGTFIMTDHSDSSLPQVSPR